MPASVSWGALFLLGGAARMRRGRGAVWVLVLVLLLAVAGGGASSRGQGAPGEAPTPALPLVPLGREQAFQQKLKELSTTLQRRRFASETPLSDAEARAGRYLDSLGDALEAEYRSRKSAPFAQPFLSVRASLATNEVFRWLRRMPKGGLLHVHGSTAGRIDWVLTNALARPDCHLQWPSDDDPGRGRIAFGTPAQIAARTNLTGYVPASELRRRLAGSPRGDLETQMRFLMQMTPGPRNSRGWTRFNECYSLIGDLTSYRPVAMAYLEDALESGWEDGISYVELRVSNGSYWEGDTRVSGLAFFRTFLELRDRVKSRHPEFDMKLIVCGSRSASVADLLQWIGPAEDLKRELGGFVAGCDLIGQEDASGVRPTADYSRLLLSLPFERGFLNLYLHDGESPWANDTNLVAAVLLNPRRIGHGFNLFRFPELQLHLIATNIALEVCPISNQSLGLISDIRVHPASGYLNRGIQSVLGSDDPLVMGNDGLTYDFWMAAMAWDLDLGMLKQLARNSFQYSAMTSEERDRALRAWEVRWNQWIADLNAEAAQVPPGTGG